MMIPVTEHSVSRYLGLIWIASTLLACQSDDLDTVNPDTTLFDEQQQTIDQYLSERSISTQQNEAGIHYQVVTQNDSGAMAEPGLIAMLYYRIEQLEGGTIAVHEESSGLPPNPYIIDDRFLLAPRGLNEVLTLMREGEEYEFYLPSRWAYLDYNQPGVIPANAIVRARIKLAGLLTPNEQRHIEDQHIERYLADNQLDEADSLASGVYYIQQQAGDTTKAVSGNSTVAVRYTGSLLDGTIFDSNADAEEPLTFTVNGASLIEGFLAGVQQMSEGEQGTVIIPSHAAYGPGAVAIPYNIVNDWLEQGATAQSIPPFAILRFDLEVVAVN